MKYLALALAAALAPSLSAEVLTIVEKGRATHVIQHAPGAEPERAVLAARELQRGIRLATGASLAIVSGGTNSPAIRLVHDGALPPDGFEFRLEGRDLIIAGNDTVSAEPGDTWFVPGHGTFYGALEFLERFAGARWLLPGEIGEDIPRTDSLRIDLAEPVRGAPALAVRQLAYIGESGPNTPGRPWTEVLVWMRRQRLTNGFHPHVAGYGHAWDDYLTPADIEAHPEWKPASGEAVRNGKVTFFCTTAPGVVETFAQRVIESLDRYPDREMSSISPTDGGGFCTCARCAKLVAVDPHGRPSHAPAILAFYKAVGGIVARERPGRRLGGFVYYNYQYPPSDAPAMPANLSLCWAPLNYYGYGLLKPVYRAEFEGVMKRWAGLTPRFFYHNYSTWMRGCHGAPLPVSLDIMRRELPAAAANRAWGARMVGTSAWGTNGPINCLLARQMWDTQLDPSVALDEWLRRAYGPGWPRMRALYDELDAKMLAHKEAQSPLYKGSQYEVNEDVMKAVHAPLFPVMESHYRAALAECATEAQRKRLGMFGDNLIQLHQALRRAKLIPEGSNSIFFRDEAAYAAFLESMKTGFSLYWDKTGLDHGPIWQGEYRAP